MTAHAAVVATFSRSVASVARLPSSQEAFCRPWKGALTARRAMRISTLCRDPPETIGFPNMFPGVPRSLRGQDSGCSATSNVSFLAVGLGVGKLKAKAVPEAVLILVWPSNASGCRLRCHFKQCCRRPRHRRRPRHDAYAWHVVAAGISPVQVVRADTNFRSIAGAV